MDGMEQINQDKIRTLWEKETYKYVGILEAGTIDKWRRKKKKAARVKTKKWHTQTPMELWHKNESTNLGWNTRPHSNQQKNRTCEIVVFAVPEDHRIKLKESEKKIKYHDFARELKKPKNYETWRWQLYQ